MEFKLSVFDFIKSLVALNQGNKLLNKSYPNPKVSYIIGSKNSNTAVSFFFISFSFSSFLTRIWRSCGKFVSYNVYISHATWTSEGHTRLALGGWFIHSEFGWNWLAELKKKGYSGKWKPIAGRFMINLSMLDSDICFSFDCTRIAVCLFFSLFVAWLLHVLKWREFRKWAWFLCGLI